MLKLHERLRNVLGTHGEIPAKEAPAPVFILGSMRSGTTYLVDKLTMHPQLLKIGSELNQVWTDIGGASIKGRCDHKTREDANGYYTYQMSHYFFQFIEESKTLKRHLMRANDLWGKGLGRISYDWDNLIPVNKSPHLMNKVGYVDGLFPRSKFLFVVRDIYAHSASMKVHFDVHYKKRGVKAFFPDDAHACWSIVPENDLPAELAEVPAYPPHFALIPQMWIKLNQLAFASLADLPRERYLVVSYEDLVRNSRAQWEKIFGFLDLAPKHSRWEKKISETQSPLINTTTKGDPLQKWRKTLSQEEIEAVQQTVVQQQHAYDAIQEQLSRLKI